MTTSLYFDFMGPRYLTSSPALARVTGSEPLIFEVCLSMGQG